MPISIQRRINAHVVTLDWLAASRMWSSTATGRRTAKVVIRSAPEGPSGVDTSSPRFLREAWRELGAVNDARVVLVFIDAAPAIVLSRQAANRDAPLRRDVRDAVLSDHLEGFEAPGDDEGPVRLSAQDVTSQLIVEQVRQAVSAAD